MRDIKRIDRILGLIKDMWLKVPDQRFGQFMLNYFSDYLTFHKEDDNLEDFLRKEDLKSLDIGDLPTWTSYLDKDNNPLPEPKVKYVYELDDDHILAIIKFCFNSNRVPMDVIREAAKRKLLEKVYA